MKKTIKLPVKFTEEHNTVEYFNKLIGKKIRKTPSLYDEISGKILGVMAVKRAFPKEDFPDAIRYKTETGHLDINFITMAELIEGGYGRGVYGFEYDLID